MTQTMVSYQRRPVSGSISFATSAIRRWWSMNGTRPISSELASIVGPRVGRVERAVWNLGTADTSETVRLWSLLSSSAPCHLCSVHMRTRERENSLLDRDRTTLRPTRSRSRLRDDRQSRLDRRCNSRRRTLLSERHLSDPFRAFASETIPRRRELL